MKRFKLLLERTALLLTLLAIFVGCPLAVWKGWPVWELWQKERIAQRIADRIDAAKGKQAQMLVRKLKDVGSPAYDELMARAVSPRAEVARMARQEVDLAFAAHRLGIVKHRRVADAEAVVVLSSALAEQAVQFGPEGARWAERLALRLIELSDHLAATQTTQLLRSTSSVLEAIPAQGPRPRRVTVNDSLPETTERMASLPLQIDLDLLSVPSESVIVQEPSVRNDSSSAPEQSTPSVVDVPITPDTGDTSPGLKPIEPVVDAEVKPLPWVSTGQSSISIEVAPPPVTPNDADDHRVPTPQQMEQRLKALRKRPTDLLVQKLPYADKFMAGTIRLVLVERGMSEQEIELARRLADADVNVRMQLVAQIARLPATSARRLLRLMVEDSNAEIRFRSLTTLATTGDPQLAEIAREIAARDDDPRVAELATELMRR